MHDEANCSWLHLPSHEAAPLARQFGHPRWRRHGESLQLLGKRTFLPEGFYPRTRYYQPSVCRCCRRLISKTCPHHVVKVVLNPGIVKPGLQIPHVLARPPPQIESSERSSSISPLCNMSSFPVRDVEAPSWRYLGAILMRRQLCITRWRDGKCVGGGKADAFLFAADI